MKTKALSLRAAGFGLVAFIVCGSVSFAKPPLELRVELDQPVLPADCVQTAIVKVTLEGIHVPQRHRAPVNVAIVIDRSGSMGGEKIEHARQAALAAVRRLDADDIVSLISYSNGVTVDIPASRVGNGRALERAIEAIEAGGGTNLYGGVMGGANQVRRYIEENRVHRIILLSDGLANVGPSSPAELAALGSELVREGISVTTVGLGLGFNEDLMTRLATRSDGNTYFVENGADLPRIFDRELGDVLNVVARSVVVEVHFPRGVKPRRIVGREGRIFDDRVVIDLNQVYGGHEKFALIEVEVAPGAADDRREIAQARARYESALDARRHEDEARATVSFTRDESAVIARANRTVQTDYARNRLAEAKDEVVALADAGRRQDAAEELRAVSSSLGDLARRFDNDDVAKIAAPAAAEAERVEADGLSNTARKAYRAENAQTVNQQPSN